MAYITHISAFLPNEPIDNDQMESVLGMVAKKPSRSRRIVLRSNEINARYYAIDSQTGKTTHSNAQLTAEAVRGLAPTPDSGVHLNQIDCLACGTSIADQIIPNHAVMVHGELKIPPCEVVATAGVCVAGITALKYAYLGVRCGEFKYAVATGSETSSASMRGRCFAKEVEAKVAALEKQPELAFEKEFLRWMLSDAAGAVLIEPQPGRHGHSLKIDWIFERSYANEVEACMYSGAIKQEDGSLLGWREHSPQAWLDQSVFVVKQDVKLLKTNVIPYTVQKPLRELQTIKNLRADDIDYFLPHYSSGFFRQKVYDGMRDVGFEIPFNRWYSNLGIKGNTGAASIYIMLEELFNSNKLHAGEKILCYVPESGRFSTSFMLLTVTDLEHD